MLLIFWYYLFFLEYLAAWMTLAGFQSLFFMRREPALALRWPVRTGIGAVASIIIVPASWWTLSLPGMPSSGYWVYNCYCIFPFSVTGIVVGLLQTRILSGKLIPIYLSTA